MEGGILVKRKVRAHPIVVGGVIRQQMAEVPFPQQHDMVEALASDRADQPLKHDRSATVTLPAALVLSGPLSRADIICDELGALMNGLGSDSGTNSKFSFLLYQAEFWWR